MPVVPAPVATLEIGSTRLSFPAPRLPEAARHDPTRIRAPGGLRVGLACRRRSRRLAVSHVLAGPPSGGTRLRAGLPVAHRVLSVRVGYPGGPQIPLGVAQCGTIVAKNVARTTWIIGRGARCTHHCADACRSCPRRPSDRSTVTCPFAVGRGVRNSADFDQLIHTVTRIRANGIMLRRPGWPAVRGD